MGLGDRGQSQAEAVALTIAAIRPNALYCSGMRRAVETAGPIGRACGLTPRVVETLHEGRMGTLSGQGREAGWALYSRTMARWMAGDLEFHHDGGESFAAIRRRVVPDFRRMAEAHRGGTIAVVSHGVVIRVLLTSLLDEFGPEDFDRIAIDFVAIHDLRREGTRWWLERTEGEGRESRGVGHAADSEGGGPPFLRDSHSSQE